MTDDTQNTQLTDTELDRLLAKAGTPVVPHDFEARMARRLQEPSVNLMRSNVIPFPQKKMPKPVSGASLPLAAALAASLMLGIWAGTGAQNFNVLPASIDLATLEPNADFANAGSEDLSMITEDPTT